MNFVELDFIQFHRIVHAHSVSLIDYCYSLNSCNCGGYVPGTYYSGVLEIGVVEKNPLIFDFVDQNRRTTGSTSGRRIRANTGTARSNF